MLYTYMVQIDTRIVMPDNQTIGIYSQGIYPAVFRVIQSAVDSVPATTGLMLLNGISQWQDSVDLTEGGNTADSGQCSLTLNNTNGLKKQLNSVGIYLQGCVFRLFLCDGTNSPVQKWIGRVSSVDSDNATLKISAIGLKSGRVTQLLKQINTNDYPYVDTSMIGKYLPACFGTLPKAKMIRTAVTIIPFVINGSKPDNFGHYDTCFSLPEDADQYVFRMSSAPFSGDVQDFPVWSTCGATGSILYYQIKFATAGTWLKNGANIPDGQTTIPLTIFKNRYIVVTAGTQKGNGRIIGDANVLLTGSYSSPYLLGILIANSNWFTKDNGDEEKLQANNTTTAHANDSWVEIQDIKRDFTADFWPCKDFTNSAGEVV